MKRSCAKSRAGEIRSSILDKYYILILKYYLWFICIFLIWILFYLEILMVNPPMRNRSGDIRRAARYMSWRLSARVQARAIN